MIIAAISIKDIIKQYKKEETEDIDPREIFLKVYHKFLEIFLKVKLDMLLLYQKGDYQVVLEKGK